MYSNFCCIRMEGDASRQDIVTPCTCYVAYRNESRFRDIVTNSFRYDLGIDVEVLKRRHPEHFAEPHNVGRAIALYHYFRQNGYRFADTRYKSIAPASLPSREPDSASDEYALWVTWPA